MACRGDRASASACMRILIDMNLSPSWVHELQKGGHNVPHWSSIGSPKAQDHEILQWAREKQHVVFTHDLDIGSILAATRSDSPSVIQIRTQDPTPKNCTTVILETLKKFSQQLDSGVLITIDERRTRIHMLPIRDGRSEE